MKLKRFLAIIALILCTTMLFASCKKDKETEADVEPPVVEDPLTLDDIFNLDWKKPDPEYPLATQKTDLNLKMRNPTPVENLIIYQDTEDYNVTRVYDFVAQKELLTFTNSITANDNVEVTDASSGYSYKTTVYTHVNNYVYAPSGKNLVVLTVTHQSLNGSLDYSETVYAEYFNEDIYNYYYDSSIKEFSATYDLKIYNTADLSTSTSTVSSNTFKSWLYSYSFSDLFYKNVVKDLTLNLDAMTGYTRIAEDLVVAKNKIYRTDADRNLTFVRDVGMSKIENSYTKGENYYYYFAYNSMTVYDSLLNPVSTYSIPSYVDNAAKFFVLNDGNVLVQYTIEEDEDGDVYDFIDVYNAENYKYTLCTYVISAADGTATEIDADYVIKTLYTAYSSDADYAGYYNSEINNIAEVYYIVDYKLENASTDIGIVSLDNNGSIVKSLKVYDEWCAIPKNLGNGYISAATVHGTNMIMDKAGNIISNALSTNTGYYNYTNDYTIVGYNGIYDAAGKNVYNWADTDYDYSILDTQRNIILIKVLANDGTYKLDLFNNGTVTTIGKMDATYGAVEVTDMITDYNTTTVGFYTVSKNSEGKDVYKYYNASGALITTSESLLSYYTSFNGVSVYSGWVTTDTGSEIAYYRFS